MDRRVIGVSRLGLLVWGLLVGAGLTACGGGNGIDVDAVSAERWPETADLRILPMTGRGDGRVPEAVQAGFTALDIEKIQRFLVAKGYEVPGASGVLTTETRVAIARYQTKAARPASGDPTPLLLTEALAFLAEQQRTAVPQPEPAWTPPQQAEAPAPEATRPEPSAPAQEAEPSDWVEPDF